MRNRKPQIIHKKVVRIMKTTYMGRQVSVPEDFKPVADTKLARFDRFFGKDGAEAVVKLSRVRQRERLELTINASGMLYRSEETEETWRNALDKAVDSIERQIRKNKTRLEKRLRDGAVSDLFAADSTEAAEDDEAILRVKEFTVQPMEAEEAILQMNLLGHDFFAYQDISSGEIEIVYRRRDGAYGLLIPKKP